MGDVSLWEELKSSVIPLKNKKKIESEPIPFPPRLRITKRPQTALSDTLDLHGLVLTEAFDRLKKFIVLHQKFSTLKVTVITGKGLKSTGAIKKEIMNWLDTSFFTDKVRSAVWKRDGGALELTLKRIKK